MTVSIQIRGLGKLYEIGERAQAYGTLREKLTDWLSAPGRLLMGKREAGSSHSHRESIWALRDVDLDVAQGDVVGLIGRNGSGKTTLLKVLAGITEPTEGRAVLRGRVGSLLEVGTGFHSELTGRENIFLSGAILGMKRAETQRKFDEIVAFAGFDAFIDTPVKHYSTGMYLRLAFAVAAHLEPEVLLVDEVLAVGDAEFQKKCIGKMGDIAREGRTVVLVSHNLAVVSSLCERGVVLEGGRVAAIGTASEAIRQYTRALVPEEIEAPDPSCVLAVRGLHAVQREGSADIRADRDWEVELTLDVGEVLRDISLRLSVRDAEGLIVVHARNEPELADRLIQPGRYAVRVLLPALWLAPGVYGVQVKVIGDRIGTAKERSVSDPLMVSVVNPGITELALPGVLRPTCAWKVKAVDAMERE
jgi:lipopolysaccharide transport system ATP-binding protein